MRWAAATTTYGRTGVSWAWWPNERGAVGVDGGALGEERLQALRLEAQIRAGQGEARREEPLHR